MVSLCSPLVADTSPSPLLAEKSLTPALIAHPNSPRSLLLLRLSALVSLLLPNPTGTHPPGPPHAHSTLPARFPTISAIATASLTSSHCRTPDHLSIAKPITIECSKLAPASMSSDGMAMPVVNERVYQ